MQVSHDEEVSGEQREKCEGRAGNNVRLQQGHTVHVHSSEAISGRVFEASIELLSHEKYHLDCTVEDGEAGEVQEGDRHLEGHCRELWLRPAQ